jgi:hypothetical protein
VRRVRLVGQAISFPRAIDGVRGVQTSPISSRPLRRIA